MKEYQLVAFIGTKQISGKVFNDYAEAVKQQVRLQNAAQMNMFPIEYSIRIN